VDDLSVKHGNQVRIAYSFAEQFAGKVVHVHGLLWFWWNSKRRLEDRGDKRVTESREIRDLGTDLGTKLCETSSNRCDKGAASEIVHPR
jgi:hypothetical protein